MIPRVLSDRPRTHAVAVADLDPAAGLEGLDVRSHHAALGCAGTGGDEDHAEVDEVEGILPGWVNGVVDVVSWICDV